MNKICHVIKSSLSRLITSMAIFRYLNWRHVAIYIYMYTCIHIYNIYACIYIYIYIYIKGLWKPYPKKYISQIWLHVVWVPLSSPKKKTVGNPNVPPVLDQGFNSEDTMTTGVFRWRASVARKNGKVWTMATLKNGWKYQRSIESIG